MNEPHRTNSGVARFRTGFDRSGISLAVAALLATSSVLAQPQPAAPPPAVPPTSPSPETPPVTPPATPSPAEPPANPPSPPPVAPPGTAPQPGVQDTISPATAPGSPQGQPNEPSADSAAVNRPDNAAPEDDTVDATGNSALAPEGQFTEEEALALEAELTQNLIQETVTDEYKLDIYGFADFTYIQPIRKFVFGVPQNTFAVGRFNLYAAADLGDRWRSLSEVRFTYLPNGTVPVDTDGSLLPRVDTTVEDYTDLDRPVRWGGVVIERVWLEYTAHPLLTIRGGQWLTPYGIWNVDHGSPVIIGVRRPFIVGESLLPERQTGLELYGTHHLPQTQLGYHFTISNGRGPIDTHQDLDANKALGGRLFVRRDTDFGTFTLGTSGYLGRFTDTSEEFTVDANGNLLIERPLVARYDEASLAADLKWEWSGLLLQSEGIVNDVVYADSVRPPDLGFGGGPPGFASDYRRAGVYGLTGYRFSFLGIMPFAGLEYYDAGAIGFLGKSAAFWGGLNVRPTPRVVLKAQYTYSWFPGAEDLPENSNYNSLDLQAAWSF